MSSSPSARGFGATDGLLLFAVALLPRAALAIAFPLVSPDGSQYLRVAENVLFNGCISLSDPASAVCVPHWGGNHPPGFPFLLAASWLLAGKSLAAGLLGQSLLFALALVWFTRAIALYADNRHAAIAAGLVLALSPLQVAWGRSVLPDTLAVAGTVFVFAELVLSLHQKRFRTVTVAIALVIAFFARYDSILLVAPIAVVALLVHDPLSALKRGLVCAMIFSLPILVWSGRNVAQGLAFVPDPFLQDGGVSPRGYLRWGNTWIASLYEGGAMAYPLQDRRYDRIEIISESAFADEQERRRVEALLKELADEWNGKPFPQHIDREFADIAAERARNMPLTQYLLLPLRRAAEYWLNPFYSFAWPIELDRKLSADDRERLANGSLRDLIWVALNHPLESFGKAGLLAYRGLLLVGTLAVILIVAVRRPGATLLALGLGYTVFRTVVLSYQPSIDTRYMIPGMALVEAIVVFILVAWIIGPRLVQMDRRAEA